MFNVPANNSIWPQLCLCHSEIIEKINKNKQKVVHFAVFFVYLEHSWSKAFINMPVHNYDNSSPVIMCYTLAVIMWQPSCGRVVCDILHPVSELCVLFLFFLLVFFI